MIAPILLDTGPLVALIDRRDYYHDWAKAQVARMKPPFFTCEAVITEACFLARALPRGISDIMGFVEQQFVQVSFRLQDEVIFTAKLMRRYQNIPMSLADACLVRMSEQHSQSTIFTLDADFKIYRRHGRQVIPTILPSA